jgi:hypothetical protein
MNAVAPILAYRVSVALVLAVLLALIILGIVVARRRWIPTAWAYVTHPLTGDDQRISFTKLFDLTIVGVYALHPNAIPASVAIVLVVSAHGTKVLMAWITGKTLSDLTSADTATPVPVTPPAATTTQTTTTTTTAPAAAPAATEPEEVP